MAPTTCQLPTCTITWTSGAAPSTTPSCWYQWTNSASSEAITITVHLEPSPFARWVSCGSTTANDTAMTAWVNWTGGVAAAPTVTVAHYMPPTEPSRAAAYAAEAARQAERLRLEEEDRPRREAADARAKALLVAHLSREQAEEYQTPHPTGLRRFHLVTPAGRRYRVERGIHGNIVELDEAGGEVARLCCQCAVKMPPEDHMLAQVLHLRTDEDGFRKVANITRVIPQTA